MPGTKINKYIFHSVTIGSDGYTSPLRITDKGVISVSDYGGAGLVLPASSGTAKIKNAGEIYGGYAAYGQYYGQTGGDGVVLSSSAKLTNTGAIYGGRGGSSADYGGTGGYSIYAGYTATKINISNSGLIRGGNGGYGYNFAGEGRAAIEVLSADIKIVNTGSIQGGTGGTGHSNAGGSGGAGIYIVYAGSILNSGVISGGYGGGSNGAPRTGGAGGAGIFSYENAKIVNKGTILGGNGDGVTGKYYTYIGGNGGVGADVGVYTPGTLINSGLIVGGNGGASTQYSGNAGNGVDLSGTAVNTGTIIGGRSFYYPGMASEGNGGIGVELSGGSTLINAGTISGGEGGYDGHGYGASEDAVYFNSGNKVASTLVVDPTGVFIGQIETRNAFDVIELAGSSANAFEGFGTKVYGFKQISFASGAAWEITGNAYGLTTGETITGFSAADKIEITDSAKGTGQVVVNTNGVVTVDIGGQAYNLDIVGAVQGETDFQFSNHTLTKTGTPGMAFLAPPEAAKTSGVPELDAFMAGQKASDTGLNPWLVSSRAYGGPVQDLVRAAHGGVQTMLTLSGSFGV